MVPAHQPGELPNSKSTQPRSETFWVTLYRIHAASLSSPLSADIIYGWSLTVSHSFKRGRHYYMRKPSLPGSSSASTNNKQHNNHTTYGGKEVCQENYTLI